MVRLTPTLPQKRFRNAPGTRTRTHFTPSPSSPLPPLPKARWTARPLLQCSRNTSWNTSLTFLGKVDLLSSLPPSLPPPPQPAWPSFFEVYLTDPAGQAELVFNPIPSDSNPNSLLSSFVRSITIFLFVYFLRLSLPARSSAHSPFCSLCVLTEGAILPGTYILPFGARCESLAEQG